MGGDFAIPVGDRRCSSSTTVPPSSHSPKPHTTLSELFYTSPPSSPDAPPSFSRTDKFKLHDQFILDFPPHHHPSSSPRPRPPPSTEPPAAAVLPWKVLDDGARLATAQRPPLDVVGSGPPLRRFFADVDAFAPNSNSKPAAVDFRQHLRRVHPAAQVIRQRRVGIGVDLDSGEDSNHAVVIGLRQLQLPRVDPLFGDDDVRRSTAGHKTSRLVDDSPLTRKDLAPPPIGAGAPQSVSSSQVSMSSIDDTLDSSAPPTVPKHLPVDNPGDRIQSLPSSESVTQSDPAADERERQQVEEQVVRSIDSCDGVDGGGVSEASAGDRKEAFRKVKFRNSILYMPYPGSPSVTADGQGVVDDSVQLRVGIDRSLGEDEDRSWEIPILQRFRSTYVQDESGGVVPAEEPPLTPSSTSSSSIRSSSFERWDQRWRGGAAAKTGGGGGGEQNRGRMAKIKGLVAMAKESSAGMVGRWRKPGKRSSRYWSQELMPGRRKEGAGEEGKKYSWSQELVATGGGRRGVWESSEVRKGEKDSTKIREEEEEEEEVEEEEEDWEKAIGAAEAGGGGGGEKRWETPPSSNGSSRKKAGGSIMDRLVKMRRSGSSSTGGAAARRRRREAERGAAETVWERRKVVIEKGKIGLAWEDGVVPLMLGAGEYELRGVEVERVVSEEEEEEVVRHGNLHRVRIKQGGHVGVVWAEGLVGGGPKLLESGSVEVFASDPAKFRLLSTAKTPEVLERQDFALGPFRVVRVEADQVGVMFAQRHPRLLHPGRHYLSMSKLEVFAGVESLLRRQSEANAIIATSKDDMQVMGDVRMEWQIKAEDVAKARLANVMNVEDNVCEKVRRAFRLAMWETNAQDIQHSSLKPISAKINTECMELFLEEEWRIILWDLHVSNIVVSSKTQRTEDEA